MDGFDDVFLNSFPDFLPFKLRGLKNASVSLLPKIPENETNQEFPYEVEDGRVK
jgi:hypothetical protein